MGAFTLNLSPLAISYFFHLVATVVWIGGMALIVLVIWPLRDREVAFRPALDAIETRFRPLANLSLVILLVTGVVQTGEDEHYGGLLDFSEAWGQAMLGKHIAYAGMVGIVLFLQFGLEPALERAKLLDQGADKLYKRQRRLSAINFGLGMVVLVFTAMATAI